MLPAPGGDEAALILETSNITMTTKFRSVEAVAGVPATTTSNNSTKKKMNPSRARRSRARLEEFTKNKVAEKEAAGDTTTRSPNMLILELGKPKDKPVETRLASPILQLDGIEEAEVIQKTETIFYSFKSDFSEEDILDSLRDIWPEDGATSTTLVLRQRPRMDSEDHLCTLKVETSVSNFSWPKMEASLVDVFREIRRI